MDTDYYDYDQFLESEVQSGNDREYLMAKISIVLAVFSSLINSFHLFILTRKDIRKLSVFVIMISISICDIISALSAVGLYSYTISVYQRPDYCLYFSSLGETQFLRVVNVVGASTFTTSVWLVVLMAGYRTLSNLFPLGELNRKLADVKTAVVSILIVVVANALWKVYPFVKVYRVYKRSETDSCHLISDIKLINKDQYQLTVFKEDLALSETIDHVNNVLLAIQILFYIAFTIVLMISLKSTKKRDNTTYLVLAMTVVFLIQDSISPILNVIMLMLQKKGIANALSNGYRTLSYTIKLVHASSQFFICYFISSIYRDVVKKLWSPGNNQQVILLKRNKLSI